MREYGARGLPAGRADGVRTCYRQQEKALANTDHGTRTLLGAVIAPACAAAAAAAGMLGERLVFGDLDVTGPVLEGIAGRGIDLWLNALLLAYPAFIGFFLLAAILNGLGLRGPGVLALCGAGAGSGGMAFYLYRTFGEEFVYELVLDPLASGRMDQAASGLTLAAIGVVSGMIGGLVFAPFAYGRR